MARVQPRFICQACGAEHRKWTGRCDACGAWNSISEESPAAPLAAGVRTRTKGHALALEGLRGGAGDGPAAAPERRLTGINELDRVLGGGLVPASAILVAGDPGIGKSTILLQACAALAQKGERTLYISGEEATDQLRMRAARTGLDGSDVRLAAATSIADIVATVDSFGTGEMPALIVIDSIQTMHVDGLDAAPGTVSQVRAAAQVLIGLAKRRKIAVIMVGHVTKEGQIAGPRVLEHMVDTVLYFEGERGHQFRILRAVKNRFGATDEIGVFEMSDKGLGEVANPSAMFLGRGGADDDATGGPVPGAAVFAGIEGTRPMLVEIQALVAPSTLAAPRRAVVGWDAARLAMIIAVLDARCGLALSGHDVYLSVAGGLRVSEPAADLAVAAALVSSLADQAAPSGTLFFGEIGLSGELRPVGGREGRLKEAAKLGFEAAIVPPEVGGRKPRAPAGLKLIELCRLADLLPLFDLDKLRKGPGTARRARRTEETEG